MIDCVISLVLTVIVGAAVLYIYKSKKNGKKCIGCPYGDSCSKSNCDCQK